MLQNEGELQVVGEASDGLEAVRKAQELKPNLILLDIGLPALNGIEAARQIRRLLPTSKILFVSEQRDAGIVKEALSTGANGYVTKLEAARELSRAVKAIVKGSQFVSAALSADGLNDAHDQQSGAPSLRENVATVTATQNVKSSRHEVGFYFDDWLYLHDVTHFIATALNAGNATVVVATESHRESLFLELQAHGVDPGTAIKQGRYLPFDAVDAVSRFTVNGRPDSVRFLELFGDLIVTAGQAAKEASGRISVFGEGVQVLCAQGNADAALEVEKFTNKLLRMHDVDMLCGYSLGGVESGMRQDLFQQICAEHSAVLSR